ncbi:cytochrome c' [Thalassotalea insulae]|uniref:Cytochrome c n=1 Tax=Thalassotalea insulae TaxID=2056778 RepID=A0ABQ6GV84_9GAMM|nr:cytochrome c [Thalassotalea insulae]GLX78557.1 cytochrome c' [Thalassotalea insulae]
MKKILLGSALISSCLMVAVTANAQQAQSEKHANRATELRQSLFSLLGSNMAPLGAMAKGKMPIDKAAIEKHATRINQLSLMINDYTKTDTSKFKVDTEALEEVWSKRAAFEKRTDDLTSASANLIKVVSTGKEGEIKKAIGGIGKTCGGCHDDFKAD